MTANNSQRLHYLDAVRAFALLAGVVFHASLSFLPVFIGWAVMDVSTSNWIGNFMLISHAFRMPLFFLIAGYFARMALCNLGSTEFLKSRFFRILIPFVIGWIILHPMIVSGWIMGNQSLRGEVDIIQGLSAGIKSLKEPMGGYFVGTHLWFLYYLLVITALMIGIRVILNHSFDSSADCKASNNPYVLNQFKVMINKSVEWFCNRPFFSCYSGLVVIIVFTAICLWNMQNWGLDTPDKSLVPHVPVLLTYSGCFLTGYLLQRHPHLLEWFGKISFLKIVFCGLAIVCAVSLEKYQMTPNIPGIFIYKVLFSVAYAMMMWLLMMIIVGVFRKIFVRSNKVVRYLSDASYWIYLIHLPIVVWLQVAFSEVNWHWSIKLCLICLLTISVSLLLYDAFVRSTLIGKQLNGKTKGRAFF